MASCASNETARPTAREKGSKLPKQTFPKQLEKVSRYLFLSCNAPQIPKPTQSTRRTPNPILLADGSARSAGIIGNVASDTSDKPPQTTPMVAAVRRLLDMGAMAIDATYVHANLLIVAIALWDLTRKLGSTSP